MLPAANHPAVDADGMQPKSQEKQALHDALEINAKEKHLQASLFRRHTELLGNNATDRGTYFEYQCAVDMPSRP